MNRPQDWSALDWYTDPIPGNPSLIEDGTVAMAAMAQTISDAASNLRSIASSDEQVSKAVDAFRERATEVAKEISLVQDRYADTATALEGYVEPLRTAQAVSLEALEEGDAARSDVLAAEQAVTDAQNEMWGAAEDDDRDAAQEAMGTAATRHNNALDALSAAKQKLNGAITQRDEAAQTAMSGIDEALEINDLNDSGWTQFLNRFEGFLDGLATVLGVIGAALAVVSLFVPGLNLVTVGIVLGVGAAGINFALAQNGNKDWGDFTMDMVGLATLGAGRIVTVAGRAGRAARAARVAENRAGVMAGKPIPRRKPMPSGRPRHGGNRGTQRRRRMNQARQEQQAEYQRAMGPTSTPLKPGEMLRAARDNINRNGMTNVLRAGGGDAYEMSYYQAMRVSGQGGGQAAEAMVRNATISGAGNNFMTGYGLYDMTKLPNPVRDAIGGTGDDILSSVVPSRPSQESVVP